MSHFAVPYKPEHTPLTVGKTLDRVWTLLRTGWKLHMALGSLLMGVMLLVEAIVFGVLFAYGVFPMRPGTTSMSPAAAMQRLAILMPLIVLLDLAFLALYALFQSAACDAALQANRGGSPTFSHALKKAWNEAGRYTWLGMLKGLAIALPVAVGFVPICAGFAFVVQGQGTINPGAEFLLFPLFLLALPAMPVFVVWLALKLSLAFPACVSEDIPAWEALKRSNLLTRGAKGRIFLVTAVVYAFNYVIVMAIEMVGFLLVSAASMASITLHVHWNRALLIAVIAAGGLIVLAMIVVLTGLTMSAVAIALSVLYDDQRLRLEPEDQAEAQPAIS